MNKKATYIGDLMIRRAHAPVDKLDEQAFAAKYRDRVRHGKTEREHKSGVHGKRFANRQRRQSFMSQNGNFPNPRLGWDARDSNPST